MRRPLIFYWIMLAIIAGIHLYSLIGHVVISIGIVVVVLPVVIYILNRRLLFSVSGIGVLPNSVLVVLQLLLVLLTLWSTTPGQASLILVIFIGIEWVRLGLANRIATADKELREYELEREQMNETFRIVRSERHDFLKHIAALHFMLEKGNSDEAKSYLDELVEGYEETNLSIKGERGTVAGILHQMYKRGKALGVEVIYDFDLPISTLPLTDKDMTALLGNLLANSLDACEEWQEKYEQQAMLSMQFYKRSGLFVLICKNNTPPVPNHILDELFETYGHTTKSGEHEGLGTKIIHDIIKKHGGFLDFVYKNEEFMVKIKIPAIQ